MLRLAIRRLLFLLRRRRHGEVACTDLVVCERRQDRSSRLMIVAHPDDESLFGGEALTSSQGWTVVCVTNASNEVRRREFSAAMASIGASYTMLDHADDLYNGNFSAMLETQLRALLNEAPYELVVTHGPSGEYGHPQHRAVHHIVRTLAGGRALYVFDVAWMARPRLSAAKRSLLAHYASQERSIGHRRVLATRERLRRVQ
jgi:LmbE family N-acetylglucosaminyl deacetylase